MENKTKNKSTSAKIDNQTKQILTVAGKILKEHKKAFEVLGNE